MLQPIGTPESFRAAAGWAFVFYRDFFGEEPSTGEEDGYIALTASAHELLTARALELRQGVSALVLINRAWNARRRPSGGGPCAESIRLWLAYPGGLPRWLTRAPGLSKKRP